MKDPSLKWSDLPGLPSWSSLHLANCNVLCYCVYYLHVGKFKHRIYILPNLTGQDIRDKPVFKYYNLKMLLVETGSFHGVIRKEFPRTHLWEDEIVVRSIGIEMEGCPQVPGGPSLCILLWKSPDLFLSGPEVVPMSRNSVPCQSLVQFSLCPCPASVVSSQLRSAGTTLPYSGLLLEPTQEAYPAAGCRAARPT